MFEVGWSEMLVIAIVMIVVVGPKDLPAMLRTFGRTTAKLRAMAADFQKQFNEALKEAELDEVKKSVDELRSLNPAAEIRKQLNPFEQAAADVRAGVDDMMKPKPAPDPQTPASSEPQPADPLKNGATVLPGVDGPQAMPAQPVIAAAEAGTARAKTTRRKTEAVEAVAKAPAKAAAKPAAKATATKAASAKPVAAKAAAPATKPAAAKAPATKPAATKPAKTTAKSAAKAVKPAKPEASAPAKKTARTAK
ncbi:MULTISPECIES: Sec-independent protein translocase protein TatB [Phyllobacteriaceae]|jgi:sec-independent protein translocase protein TatB|uniref:Sec-independent protein translocase protein TatB n=1 Tax=Mesorhizobium hungaricum TaxID=1566387 RepID=A0A1C2DN61_9HYPH|nr:MULTISPECIES: Sec-independent protein translocase protein TatB [Mesorhizobium]MBN9237839.1 twin-arginine translocase subunit TatB [Mesorhizobium sp.]MDQ0328257.1 sec-independent protein translocase protein TatB [Mesorhizobium sp. YL-MeA3-2017]OCX16189.1 twin arginine-targeting protein translocase TatB [Mesorhizobium hungaricum]